MFRTAVCVRAVRTLRFVVTGLLLTLAAAHAGPVSFGNRSIYIPDPDGFLPLSKPVPRFIQLAQAYLPKNIRLVEVYATPPDTAALEQGTPTELKRYFQLQTAQSTDGVPVSNEDFAAAATQIEQGMRQALGEAASTLDAQTDKGNAEVKRQTSIDPKL